MASLAIGGLGALAGGLLNYAGQAQANKANIGMAREQMAFQEIGRAHV